MTYDSFASAKSVTVDSVKSFQIYENYQSRFPCSHRCKIILKDDRKIKTGLNGPEIYLLIQAIAKEKITFKRDPEFISWDPQSIDHFNSYKKFDWKFFCPTAPNPPLPEQILSKAFQQKTF